jgi:hypothetical protein
MDFHGIWYWRIFKKSVKKIQVSLKSDSNNSTLHENQYTFFIISRSVLLRMRDVSDKSCRENQNTHFVLINSFFFFENCPVYEILWKNITEWGRPQMKIWHMPIACWIPKATNTHTEYVKLIAFPLQQWLHVRASMLHYTYTACLVLCTQNIQ